MAQADIDTCLQQLQAKVRRINLAVAVAAFASYGLAFYVWTLDQNLGAIVIASLGYLAFRSMRKISFNLTWQSFADRPGYAAILQHLDEYWVSRPLDEVRAHVQQSMQTPDGGTSS